MQNFLSSRTAVISCCIISGLLCVAGSALFYRKLNEQKAAYQDMLMNTADSLYLTMREIQRLSYMLMLNTEVQTFVTQGAIAQGSADIQTIINAQRQLSYIKSVHPEIAGLYIYSKKSGYLLEADNAFFDINFMYPSLLEFEGLNSSQWRERYLRPIYTNAWLPECTGISKGNRQLLLVFAQTFPLQNTAANTGKLLILLHSSYFKNQLRLLAPSNEAVVQLADERSGILLSYCGNGASTAASLQTAIQPFMQAAPLSAYNQAQADHTAQPPLIRRIKGRNHLIFVQPVRNTGTVIITAFPQTVLYMRIIAGGFWIVPAVLGALLCCTGYAVFTSVRLTAGRSDSCSGGSAEHSDECLPVMDSQSGGNTAPAALPEKDAAFLVQITGYVEKHYTDSSLNLSQMAKDLSMKENFLYYFFRSRMKKSFAQYLEDIRLEKARRILEHDMRESLIILSEQCGYANPQTFRRAFKKRYGLTPSEFRQQTFIRKDLHSSNCRT